jgi:hypothetical protein
MAKAAISENDDKRKTRPHTVIEGKPADAKATSVPTNVPAPTPTYDNDGFDDVDYEGAGSSIIRGARWKFRKGEYLRNGAAADVSRKQIVVKIARFEQW